MGGEVYFQFIYVHPLSTLVADRYFVSLPESTIALKTRPSALIGRSLFIAQTVTQLRRDRPSSSLFSIMILIGYS
jgi:hypothetical protein